MKIFAEPSEFQMPPDNSSLRQHSNSITQNLLGMETPPAPLLFDGDLDNNYATIQPSYSHNNSSSLVNNSRSTNNTINLIDSDYQTLRNSPRAPTVSNRIQTKPISEAQNIYLSNLTLLSFFAQQQHFEFNGSTFQVQQQQNDHSSDFIGELM